MRAKLEQLSQKNSGQSFLCYEVKLPSFDFFWHYHPEYELTYIIKGSGKRLVGDSYENFDDGDLVLLGPSLPHTWFTENMSKQNYRAIVIQFSLNFIEPMLQYNEMADIKKLLKKADKGLKFSYQKSKELSMDLHQILQTTGLDSITSLLSLLQKLSSSRTISLATPSFRPMKGNQNQQRINIVFQYVQQQFKKGIRLQEAANLIHLSESAFCKFFKRVSGKTFSDYVNDIRIAHACELLIESDMLIEQIAYESGFDSLTYFNRIFLKKKATKPGSFRKKE